jgi:DinB superfamily
MRFAIPQIRRAFACSLLAAASTFAFAQAPAKPAVGTPVPPAQIYGHLLSQFEKGFVGAAEAMPEDKFDFAPPATAGEFKGVRTFAGEIKHVTQANYYFFSGPNVTDADVKAKGDQLDKLKSKAEIVQALKDSFTQAHAYIDAITPENAFVQTANGTRAGMAAMGIAHFMDHYGQMVEYLRMNSIVPPASRPN